MPNHCFNYVTITGAGTAAIKKKLGSRKVLKEGILRQLVPMPEILQGSVSGGNEYLYKEWVSQGKPETIYDGKVSLDTVPENYEESYRTMFANYDKAHQETGHTSWYNWCLENWGSKWGFYDVEVKSFRKDKIVFRAQSAWSPPSKGLETISKLYDVQVEIETEEEACQFAFIGNYYPSGLANEEEMPGYMHAGEYPTISEGVFDKFKHLIRYHKSKDEDPYLEEMTYHEYVIWNNIQ